MNKMTSKLLVAGISAAVFMTACSDKGGDSAGKVIKQAPVADASLVEVQSSKTAAIVAKKVSDSLAEVGPQSDIWDDASFSDVTLYPQTTISFNDKKAIEMNKGRKAVTAKIAAVYNDKDIALTLRWEDATNNQPQGDATDTYADGVAFQFAKTTDATKLPYIGMGSEGREVAIYLQKAQYNTFEPNGNGNVGLQVSPHQTNFYGEELAKFNSEVAKVGSDDYERVFVSAGFRSMTEVKDGSSKSNMKMERLGDKGWAVTLVRPLTDSLADLGKSFPVAIALWDGGKNNRNGLKLLSGWNAVTVTAEDKALVATVNEQVKGDVANGKAQAIANCAACHKLGVAEDMAPDYMAPDLSNIGGYATAAYIKESMMAPNAVVVPGYNRNAHKNFKWYELVDGKRMSTMPGFDWLDEKSRNDIIAFMQTLKAKGE